MTILSPETLLNFLDLIESGVSSAEASAAVGCAPGSKVAHKWISDSRMAAEFGARPDPSSPFCVTWGEREPEWLHLLYEQARANGRANRAARVPPIRRELEERLDAKRAGRVPAVEPSLIEQRAPPEVIIERARQAAVIEPPPPAPPRERPSYALKRAPALDTTNANGPPIEGRFSMVADRPKSKRELQSGLPEITELGVRIN